MTKTVLFDNVTVGQIFMLIPKSLVKVGGRTCIKVINNQIL